MQEPERAYLLARAHAMREAVDSITKCPAATRARTAEEAKAKRVEAAPAYLRSRVEEDEALPEVRITGGGAAVAGLAPGGELPAVMEHVMWELKRELVVELIGFIRPKWSEGKVTWESDDDDDDEEEEEEEEEEEASTRLP